MGKSNSSSGIQSSVSAKSPFQQLTRDPRVLRRAHDAVYQFVEQFETEVQDAEDAAHARQLAAIKRIEQTGRYLHSQYLLADQVDVACPRKPRGLAPGPDFILGLIVLEPVSLVDCLDRLHNAIIALQPYEGEPFGRKPVILRQFRDMRAPVPTKPGPEQIALTAMERAADDILNLFRGLVKQLAGKCTARAPRKEKSKGDSSGMLTPPQVAKQLGVSPDKILAWIRKGELRATNAATSQGGRPRYKISEENLTKFQEMRQNVKPPAKPSRRRKKDPNVTEYF